MKPNNKQKLTLSKFKDMYGTYHSSLIIFAEKYVQDLSLAKDIVQEVFIKVWEKDVVFLSQNAVKSYLYTSVRNKSLDYLKSKEFSVKKQLSPLEMSILESDSYFEKELLMEEVSRLVHEAVNTLPYKCKEIILLSLKGLKNEQISEELSVSINTVKTQKRIAYQKLRPMLNGAYVFIAFIFN